MIISRNIRKNPAEPVKLYETRQYDGKELRPFEGRSGALDAFKLPSVRGSKIIPPAMYMSRGEK